jgi:hypothetical protein
MRPNAENAGGNFGPFTPKRAILADNFAVLTICQRMFG